MKVMKTTYHIGTGLVLLLALLLAACNSDSSDSTSLQGQQQQPAERQLQLSLASSTYQNDDGTNRALPTGYVPLTDERLLQAFPNGKDMLAFIAHTTNASEVFIRRMNYVTKDNNVTDWEKNITITDYSAPYCIYGFIPISDDTSDNASVSLLNSNSNYGQGAKMTISNLKPLTVSDPCVIVGAKEWGTATSINDVGIQLGAFSYTFNKEETTDRICMLLDHLYARFKFKIAVGANYDALRTVKVKKMTLEALDANDNVVKAVTATVNIEANTTGSNPISSIAFTRTAGEITPYTLYDDTDTPYPLVLQTTPTAITRYCLAPYNQVRFQLTTDYEVYSKPTDTNAEPQLLKTHTGVKNKFTAAVSSDKQYPGYEHTITITVNPTYLQVLSDDDLDNPTIKVN
jgi:hypothetical protein